MVWGEKPSSFFVFFSANVGIDENGTVKILKKSYHLKKQYLFLYNHKNAQQFFLL